MVLICLCQENVDFLYFYAFPLTQEKKPQQGVHGRSGYNWNINLNGTQNIPFVHEPQPWSSECGVAGSHPSVEVAERQSLPAFNGTSARVTLLICTYGNIRSRSLKSSGPYSTAAITRESLFHRKSCYTTTFTAEPPDKEPCFCDDTQNQKQSASATTCVH